MLALNCYFPKLFLQGNYYVQAPMIIFGSSSVTVGLVVLLLPETLNKTQPQSIDDAERMHACETIPIVKKEKVVRT